MRKTPWIVVTLLGSLLLTGGCSTNMATGQRQLNMIGTSQEVAMGSEAAPQFTKSYGGAVPSDSIRSYVNELGMKLAKVSERPDLPWEFTIVDSSVLNAFALPGGKVFISRGLAVKLTSEAQLAGVLGHEVGHVTAQHIGQQMTQALIIQGLGIGLAVAGEQTDNDLLKVLGVGTTVGGGVYMLKFGRDQESQADMLGVRYMTKLGYNPTAQLQVMNVLAQASKGPRPPEFLSTHPLPQTRIRRLEKLIKEKYPDYNNLEKYPFYHQRYEQRMLRELARLPKAKHTGEQSQKPQAAYR